MKLFTTRHGRENYIIHQEEGSSQDKVFHRPQNVQVSISNVRVRLQVLVRRAADCDKTAPSEFTVNQPLSSFSWKKWKKTSLFLIMAVQTSLPDPLYSLLLVDATQHHLVHDQVVVVGLVGYHVPHTVGVKVKNSVLTTIPLPNRIHLW